MISDEHLTDLNLICAGAKEMAECGSTYIFLPALHLPEGCTPRQVDALLRRRAPTQIIQLGCFSRRL